MFEKVTYGPFEKVTYGPLEKMTGGSVRKVSALADTSDISDVLRDAVRRCGLSAAGLSKRTGVSQPGISVFMQGKDIRLSTAQKLAAFLGLELVSKKPRRKK